MQNSAMDVEMPVDSIEAQGGAAPTVDSQVMPAVSDGSQQQSDASIEASTVSTKIPAPATRSEGARMCCRGFSAAFADLITTFLQVLPVKLPCRLQQMLQQQLLT